MRPTVTRVCSSSGRDRWTRLCSSTTWVFWTAQSSRLRSGRSDPTFLIVMLAEHAELPAGALQAVDVLVSTSDPPHFLWAAVHFLLTVKPAQHREGRLGAATPAHLRRPSRSREGLGCMQRATLQSVSEERDAPFSVSVWKSILNGTAQC